jgi:hypothetical protein
MYKQAVAVILTLCLGGCATHAVTSGRFVVRDSNATIDVRFSDPDRVLIQDYYRGTAKNKHQQTPPGLAQRSQLPPGLAKRDTLPPGLQGRDLPGDLEARLTVLPAPYVRLIIGSDIVLMNGRTRVVMDVMRSAVTD